MKTIGRPFRIPLLWAPATLLALGVAGSGCTSAPAQTFDVMETTISEVQAAILDGRTTCRAVVDAYLARIDAYNEPGGLHAISMVNPRAGERADSIDAALARGEDPGPLACAPILVKDNFDTHDLPTTGGSVALANSLPPDDAFMVRRIREDGAIVIAKTNMAEWAFSPRQTVSSSYGTTANAYALDRVPAGSSGGTASGVAANLGVAGLGSDTGNSIRGPSSHLALFGIRSTIGLTSRDGVIPLSFDRDIAGPMTRTVRDGAILFNSVAGYDPQDPYTEAGRGRKEPDYTTFLDVDGLQGARVGVLRALVPPERSDSSVVRVFEEALTDLAGLGATVVDPFEVPGLDEWMGGPYYCQRFRYDMSQYLASLGADAPIRDVAEVLQSGQYSEYVRGRLEGFSEGELGGPPEADDPERCNPYEEHTARQAFKDAVVAAMDAAELDVVVYPTWTHPPAPLDRAQEEYRGDNSQRVVPATGLPAATVPMGYSYGEYPAGLQIMARPYQEGLIFRVAYAFEQGTRHRRPPEGFGALGVGPE